MIAVTPHPFQTRLHAFDPVRRTGRVRRIFATHIEADGPDLPLGALCVIETPVGSTGEALHAEVVRVDRDSIILSPLRDGCPVRSGALVTAAAASGEVPAGDAFLGRAVDALARPIDGLGPVRPDATNMLQCEAPSPLTRASPAHIFETGIRAIDGLLTLGVGQRIGMFAPSGAGKTTLMTQIAQQAQADVTVICLIGERGREVEGIWNTALTAEARSRSTLVAATSDQSAAMRVRAGHFALALADHWRSQGKHVLLLLDSVTRLAMAMRETGLAAGEPPTVRAYTPGVFAAMPKIVERCGALRNGGAITAIMTVLSEGDDIDDPVCEMMKSILDGHILLSRHLAEQGHFPAIDIPRSISRHADSLLDDRGLRHARQVHGWLAQYEASRTLIEAGLYARSANPEIDRAIEKRPSINGFLQQNRQHRSALGATTEMLARIVESAL